MNPNPNPKTAVELLATEDERQTNDIKTFQREISTARKFDDIDIAVDDAASDPIHDHLPRRQAKASVRGVLSILDDLDRGNTK